MKSKILSLLGVGAIAMAVACNSSSDETTNRDTLSNSSTTTTTSSSTTPSVQTSADGKKYVVRTRTSSTSADNGNATDTIWVYMGTQDRWYTLSGPSDRDTLYFDTDEWKTWWTNPKTDDELKSKSNGTKVKIEKDGSWKVKDDTSKTKMTDKGKVKSKPKG